MLLRHIIGIGSLLITIIVYQLAEQWASAAVEISWQTLLYFLLLLLAISYLIWAGEGGRRYHFTDGWLVHEQRGKARFKIRITDYTWKIEGKYIYFDNHRLDHVFYRSRLWYWILRGLQDHEASITSDWAIAFQQR